MPASPTSLVWLAGLWRRRRRRRKGMGGWVFVGKEQKGDRREGRPMPFAPWRTERGTAAAAATAAVAVAAAAAAAAACRTRPPRLAARRRGCVGGEARPSPPPSCSPLAASL